MNIRFVAAATVLSSVVASPSIVAAWSPDTEPDEQAIGTPLRMDAPSLPPAYAGDSLDAVIASLQASPKNEFETTAQFQQRAAALRPNRTFSFWMERSVMRRYDADRQVLKVELAIANCTYIGFGPNCGISSLLLSPLGGSSSSYVGTNAFGVATKVTSIERRNLGLILTPQKGVSIDLETSLDIETAKRMKDSVDVLVTVGPNQNQTASMILTGKTSLSATLSSPVETHETYVYLNMPIVAIWLADRATGEVLAKFEPH